MSPKIFTILLILIPVFLYYGFLNPFYNGVPGLVWTPEQTLASLQSQNASYGSALNQVALLKLGAKKLNDEYLAILPEDKEKVMIMLPESIDQIKLINEVKKIADGSGIAIGSVTVALDQKSVNKNVSAYGVSFSLNAKYSDFKRLMQDFEKNMRFFTVESITIKRPDASEAPVQGQGVFDKEALKIGLTFRVHYLKP